MNTHWKNLTLIGAIAAGLLVTALTATARDDAHKHNGGPRGGRLIGAVQPHPEFLLAKDRTASIAFYDEAMKQVPVTDQMISLVAEGKAGKVKIEFEKKGDLLVSKGPLPEGDGYTVVLLFRQTASAKPQNFRFKLELYECGGCKRVEYACTCDH